MNLDKSITTRLKRLRRRVHGKIVDFIRRDEIRFSSCRTNLG
jgi:hypothetical protein